MCAERPRQGSSNLDAVLTGLQGRVATFAPGTVFGAGIYLHTGRLWHALVLAGPAGSPTRAIQTVVVEWIELLRPPKRWRRRRRRSS